MRLVQFLNNSKSLFLRDPSRCSLVMGNEAGALDLDSIASAIAFAWFSSGISFPANQQLATNPTLSSSVIVPLIRIPRDHFHLRPENIAALQLAGIHHPQSQLLTTQDLTDNILSHLSPNVSLVDHNSLSFFPTNSSFNVSAIIDHHADEGLYHDTANPRIIQPVGSCASLIVRHFLKDSPSNSSPPPPPELASLLLSAILLDNGGLYSGTPVDSQAADLLAPYIPLAQLHSDLAQKGSIPSSSPSLINPSVPVSFLTVSQHLTSHLAHLKSDLSSLSIPDHLRRDFKTYTFISSTCSIPIKIGLSTVPVKLKSWAWKTWTPSRSSSSNSTSSDSDDLIHHSSQFMKSHSLDILGILTTYRTIKKGKHKRENLWMFRQSNGGNNITKIKPHLLTGLENSQELRLVKHPRHSDMIKSVVDGDQEETIEWQAYKQSNAKATRKVIAPLVKSLVESS